MVTPNPIVTEDFEDRFRRHLPKLKDPALIVLKGHLLVEEAVNRFVKSLLPNPDALSFGPSGLSCYERMRLLRALLPKDEFDDVLDKAEKLNSLRNKFGHNLEPAQIESQIETFVRLFEDPEIPMAEFQSEPLARRLKRSISFLCGELHGLEKGYIAARTIQGGE